MTTSPTSTFEQFQASSEKVLSAVNATSEVTLETYKKSFEAVLELGNNISSAAAGVLTESLDGKAPYDILQRQKTLGEAAMTHTQTYVETAREIFSSAQKDLSEIAKGFVPSFAKFS